MVVNPSVPAKSVPEFIAYAKANPGKLTMASAGTGATSHLSGELFKMMAGVDMVTALSSGRGPGLTDLLGGQAQVMFASISSSPNQCVVPEERRSTSTSRAGSQESGVPMKVGNRTCLTSAVLDLRVPVGVRHLRPSSATGTCASVARARDLPRSRVVTGATAVVLPVLARLGRHIVLPSRTTSF